jgi:hypothetical protein
MPINRDNLKIVKTIGHHSSVPDRSAEEVRIGTACLLLTQSGNEQLRIVAVQLNPTPVIE